jgi:outer membrane protein OmpA-like peptidoglycan-associated protein
VVIPWYAGESTKYQLGGFVVKFNIRKWKLNVSFCATVAILLAGVTYAAANKTRQLAAGDKARVTGSILSRDGDLVHVRDKKSGEVVVVNITDNTRIDRKKHSVLFPRHTDMDVTAMVPGLTIEAEGVGNSKGQLDADRISFTPDEFAVEVAQQRQIVANKAAAQNAQSTADQGTAAAGLDAQAAGALGIADAAAIAKVNQRVSDSNDYKNEFEVDVFFARDSAVLDETAKRDLANLADIAKSLDRYLIEIAGYTSNTLGAEVDQKLSEDRAAAVARYFREVKNIPMRRILVPVGYGATHPAVSNKDLHDRELNRRVDIKWFARSSATLNLDRFKLDDVLHDLP